jgi:GT2 family glycosyltransferase
VKQLTERVGVVVVTYNSADVLPGLLASLPDGLSGLDWDLVVVDNGSQDRSVVIVRDTRPEAVCIETGRNGGYAAGFNIGVAALPDATAVMVLNADVRLDPGCVAELLRALHEPGTGIAVPLLTDGHGDLVLSMRREPAVGREVLETILGGPKLGRIWDAGVMVADQRRYAVEMTTDWAEGSTQLISRECLNACGPWDESYFLFSEETEFGLRAKDKGYATRFVPSRAARPTTRPSGRCCAATRFTSSGLGTARCVRLPSTSARSPERPPERRSAGRPAGPPCGCSSDLVGCECHRDRTGSAARPRAPRQRSRFTALLVDRTYRAQDRVAAATVSRIDSGVSSAWTLNRGRSHCPGRARARSLVDTDW